MSATFLGMILSIVFLGYMISHAVSDLRVFNDIPGFLLICGSTVAVALMIYTGKETGNIFKLMAKTFKSHKDTNPNGANLSAFSSAPIISADF